MSFDPEELRIDIFEAFEDATALNTTSNKTDFGELARQKGALHIPSFTDEELRAEIRGARRAARPPTPRRVPLSPSECYRKQVVALARFGACQHCGAMARSHRCPVYIVGVST